jgi:hypothetical protein
VAAAMLTFVLWPCPTGWVVVGLALTLLFALAIVDFAGEDIVDVVAEDEATT